MGTRSYNWYSLTCTCHTVGLLDEAPGLTLRILLGETGSAIDIWLVPYMRFVGVCLSSNGGMAFSTEGPERGVIETNILSALWLKFVGRSVVLLRKPIQPRKTCK